MPRAARRRSPAGARRAPPNDGFADAVAIGGSSFNTGVRSHRGDEGGRRAQPRRRSRRAVRLVPVDGDGERQRRPRRVRRATSTGSRRLHRQHARRVDRGCGKRRRRHRSQLLQPHRQRPLIRSGRGHDVQNRRSTPRRPPSGATATSASISAAQPTPSRPRRSCSAAPPRPRARTSPSPTPAVPAFDVSLFECRLDSDDPADFQPCPNAGMSFTGLADGAHRFDVRAGDFDTNVDPSPATHSFTVDTVAPDTSILDGPSGTIETDSASFTYSGSADATGFECRLDGAAFADCPAEGKTFAGLALGSHEFAVRSRDAAGNIDASPAARTFTVTTSPVVVPPPATPDTLHARPRQARAGQGEAQAGEEASFSGPTAPRRSRPPRRR